MKIIKKNKMSSTRGLKAGDIILYDDGVVRFLATVINVTSSQKAQIRSHMHVNDLFQPQNLVNTYRKYMTIVRE